MEGERDRGKPRATWTDNIKEWMGNWRESWRVKETGEDQESHGQTTSRCRWVEWWRVKETGEQPRVTWTDNIKEWMGNIGGNGKG